MALRSLHSGPLRAGEGLIGKTLSSLGALRKAQLCECLRSDSDSGRITLKKEELIITSSTVFLLVMGFVIITL